MRELFLMRVEIFGHPLSLNFFNFYVRNSIYVVNFHFQVRNSLKIKLFL